MIRKILLTTVLILCGRTALFALYPEQDAAPLTRIKWLQGIPLSTAESSDAQPQPEFRAVVFLLCRAVVADESAAMLADLQRTNSGRLKIAIITPDPETDAREFIRRHPDSPLAVGADTERHITSLYMGGSLLFPQAFLIDRKGEIIWRGEAIDLGEAVDAAIAGKLDAARQAKIARLLDELQSRMRDNRDLQQHRTAQAVFALDPANAAALRMRLFTLENTGRLEEARQLVDSRIAAAPQVARLYFTALDLTARRGSGTEKLPQLLEKFRSSIKAPALHCAMARTLLEHFPMNVDALREAARLLKSVEPGTPEFFAARALLHHRLGNTAGAVSDQQQVVEAAGKSGVAARIRDAENRLNFYRSVISTAQDFK